MNRGWRLPAPDQPIPDAAIERLKSAGYVLFGKERRKLSSPLAPLALTLKGTGAYDVAQHGDRYFLRHARHSRRGAPFEMSTRWVAGRLQHVSPTQVDRAADALWATAFGEMVQSSPQFPRARPEHVDETIRDARLAGWSPQSWVWMSNALALSPPSHFKHALRNVLETLAHWDADTEVRLYVHNDCALTHYGAARMLAKAGVVSFDSIRTAMEIPDGADEWHLADYSIASTVSPAAWPS